jgi:hypothetical protein
MCIEDGEGWNNDMKSGMGVECGEGWSVERGGVVEWWSGGVVEWWSGGVVEWWSGGVVEWWSGGVKGGGEGTLHDLLPYIHRCVYLPYIIDYIRKNFSERCHG